MELKRFFISFFILYIFIIAIGTVTSISAEKSKVDDTIADNTQIVTTKDNDLITISASTKKTINTNKKPDISPVVTNSTTTPSNPDTTHVESDELSQENNAESTIEFVYDDTTSEQTDLINEACSYMKFTVVDSLETAYLHEDSDESSSSIVSLQAGDIGEVILITENCWALVVYNKDDITYKGYVYLPFITIE